MLPPNEFAFAALRADAMVYQELTERRGGTIPKTARRCQPEPGPAHHLDRQTVKPLVDTAQGFEA